MPSPVACPVCGADGTAAANQIMAQTLASQPAPAPSLAPPPTMLRPATAPAPVAVPPPSTAPSRPTAQDAMRRVAGRAGGEVGKGDNWKWWYFVLAGFCFGGYAIWQAYESQSIKPLGELFFAVLCIAIGIWDFQRKRKAKKAQG
jgi:hypothetical protein